MASLKYDRTAFRLLVGTVLVGFAILAFGHSDILDTRFYYTGEFAQLFFALLSPEQTRAYIRTGILDLVFIHFYSSLIWYQFTKLNAIPKFRKLALAPSLLDLFETVSILLILLTGVIPQNLDWLGVMTAGKWSTGALVFLWWLYLLFVSRRRQTQRGV